MITLYHRWSSIPAQQVRMALRFKGITVDEIALPQQDDDIWFTLGHARADFALQLPDRALQTDTITTLRQLDDHLGGEPVYQGLISDDAWQALLAWRDNIKHIRDRLYAPVLPAFSDIGGTAADLASYKAQIQHQYGMSVEALSNDRYDGFNQLVAQANLIALGKHLAKQRFYLNNRLSACDILIASDLFPLQLLDGVTMPLDLMYYIQRVETACHTSLRAGLIIQH
ncbi:MAG: glutathione S-transferase N-terminal domain-containing protein [Sulfuriferula sp.]